MHLLHHVPAMDFHGDFAGPELKSYLLIEHARNDQCHDLPLARGHGFVTPSQFGKLALLLAHHPVAIQSLVDRIQQVLVAEGLGEELHCTGFHGLYRHRDIAMTGDEDDGNENVRVSQLPLKVQTVDSRKSHIQDEAAWSVRSFAAEELSRGSEGLGPQAHRLQQALDRRTHRGIVINDEHCRDACGHHLTAAFASQSRKIGSAKCAYFAALEI